MGIDAVRRTDRDACRDFTKCRHSRSAAFRGLDASGVEDLYVDDADWTNAFGTTLKGNREIAGYLRDQKLKKG